MCCAQLLWGAVLLAAVLARRVPPLPTSRALPCLSPLILRFFVRCSQRPAPGYAGACVAGSSVTIAALCQVSARPLFLIAQQEFAVVAQKL